MPELIFSILNLIWIVFLIGVSLYIICLHFSSDSILNKYKQEEKYDEYLEMNGCKRYEYAISEECKNKQISSETTEDTNIKENKLMRAELDLCNEFIRENINNLFARERRAQLHLVLHNYDESINDYRYLMKKQPKNFNYVIGCAESYAYWNNLNTALLLINKFYKNKKHDSEYFNALGSVFKISKNYQLAIRNYSEAIKLKPHWLYYSNRALAYKEAGDMGKYQADYDKYQELIKTITNDNNSVPTHSEINSDHRPFYKNSLTYKIGLVLLVLAVIIYFHPTKEVMYCNPNHICKIERTYFGTFKTNKKLTLNSASNMSCHIGAYARGKHHTDYGLYLRFDGIAPFVFYVADSTYSTYKYQKEELNSACNQYYQSFRKYISNYGKYQYRVESKADTGKLIFSIIMILIMLLAIFGEDIGKSIKKCNK